MLTNHYFKVKEKQLALYRGLKLHYWIMELEKEINHLILGWLLWFSSHTKGKKMKIQGSEKPRIQFNEQLKSAYLYGVMYIAIGNISTLFFSARISNKTRGVLTFKERFPLANQQVQYVIQDKRSTKWALRDQKMCLHSELKKPRSAHQEVVNKACVPKPQQARSCI